MTVQLKWGSYAFDAGSVAITTSVETVRNEYGRPYKQRKRISCDGTLTGSSQSAVDTAIAALDAALKVPYQDLTLYLDGGGESSTKLSNSDSLSGVVIVSGPDYPSSEGGEYVNKRRFTFAAEAEYALSGTSNWLVSWSESLRFSGGGSLYVLKPAIIGPPQKQRLIEQTPYHATQSGEAVGFLAYPRPARPIWPADLVRAGEPEYIAPKRVATRRYEGWTVRWNYEFASASPLVGLPTLWKGD